MLDKTGESKQENEKDEEKDKYKTRTKRERDGPKKEALENLENLLDRTLMHTCE
jgi:hypothetical protein